MLRVVCDVIPKKVIKLFKFKTKEIEMLKDFINTKTSKDKLKIALEVIQEFKECESNEDICLSCESWYVLEMLEGQLQELIKE
jgi:hypothetical protein